MRARTLGAIGTALCLYAWLATPALSTARHEDDHIQRAWALHQLPTSRAAWDLYRFFDPREYDVARLHGLVPWWLPREARVSVFRPFSSLLVWLDANLFGLSDLAAHLHSFVWILLLAVAFWRFVRRFASAYAATFTVAWVLTSESALHQLAWVANRCGIISGALALLAFTELSRWCTENTRRRGVVGGALWLLALLAGEYTFAYLPFGIALVAFNKGDLRRRLQVAVAVLTTAVFCYAISRVCGYGGGDFAATIDPWAAPLQWLSAVPVRAFTLLTMVIANGIKNTPVVGLGLTAVVAIGCGLRAFGGGRWRLVLGWGGATLASLCVLSSGLLQPRVTLPVVVGGALLIASGWDDDATTVTSSRATGRPLRALMIGMLVAGLVLFRVTGAQNKRQEQVRQQQLLASGTLLRANGATRVVVLSSVDPELWLNPSRAWQPVLGYSPQSWLVATPSRQPLVLLRSGVSTFEVRGAQPLLPFPASTLARAGVGEGYSARVERCVLSLHDFSAGVPRVLRITFDEPYESSGWSLVAAQGTRVTLLARLPVHGAMLIAAP